MVLRALTSCRASFFARGEKSRGGPAYWCAICVTIVEADPKFKVGDKTLSAYADTSSGAPEGGLTLRTFPFYEFSVKKKWRHWSSEPFGPLFSPLAKKVGEVLHIGVPLSRRLQTLKSEIRPILQLVIRRYLFLQRTRWSVPFHKCSV